ncbi:hypothetical protein [Spirosoma sp. KNUC1025]|uniref:hypothetical protein n=1 Tax=Spirosoma sp. KNUC1025 TaxID=2894082 RepID=UPI001E5DF68F|nr:hypothetical protein [Spirosoma sp. KNUC1025]UFH57694.1 hypothetical protein LN737_32215 [Spirosoma sp. KNUC1025]
MKSFLFAFLLLVTCLAQAQVNIYTADLRNFYMALDSIQTTLDSVKQQRFLQTYYFDQASPGLKKFIELDIDRNNQPLNAKTLLQHITQHKELYTRKRTWITATIERQKEIIETKIKAYKKLYPEFRDGDIVFVIGREVIGGKPNGKDLLIGAEVLASENKEWAVPIVLHEYTHTQQWLFRNIQTIFSKTPVRLTQILANAIWEGNADFMAEKVYGTPLERFYPHHYNSFGYQHEALIWGRFKEEMFSPLTDNKQWFYADKEFNGEKVRDIGYFIGHQICQVYYRKAKDKKKAIADMINLQLDSDEAAFGFLVDSGYATAAEVAELSKRFAASKRKD